MLVDVVVVEEGFDDEEVNCDNWEDEEETTAESTDMDFFTFFGVIVVVVADKSKSTLLFALSIASLDEDLMPLVDDDEGFKSHSLREGFLLLVDDDEVDSVAFWLEEAAVSVAELEDGMREGSTA